MSRLCLSLLISCDSNHSKLVSVKFQSQWSPFHLRKCNWKCCLKNIGSFCCGLNVLRIKRFSEWSRSSVKAATQESSSWYIYQYGSQSNKEYSHYSMVHFSFGNVSTISFFKSCIRQQPIMLFRRITCLFQHRTKYETSMHANIQWKIRDNIMSRLCKTTDPTTFAMESPESTWKTAHSSPVGVPLASLNSDYVLSQSLYTV